MTASRRPLKQGQAFLQKRGRPGIGGLPFPDRRFDVSRTPNFEGAQDDEDALRARMLRREAKRRPANSAALLGLAARIDPAETCHPKSLASSRYMREQRMRIISALWQVLYEA